MKYMQVYLDILNSSWFSEQIKTNIKTRLDPNLKLELKKKKEKKKKQKQKTSANLQNVSKRPIIMTK